MSDTQLFTVAPPTPDSDVFPTWTDLVDNWRAADAHWLRNRVMQIFPDAATRTTELTGHTTFGMMSIVPLVGAAVGGPDFWTGSAWESIRYPNLGVASDGTSVTLKRVGGSGGVQLVNDGSVNASKLFGGTGGVGGTLDVTGVTVKVGAKTAKLATNATDLTVDSPVNVSGGVTASGTVAANALSAPTVTASTTLTAAAAGVTTLTATGAVTGASVAGGDALLGTSGVYGTLKHRTGGTSLVGVGSDSTVKIEGSSLAVTPPASFAATANFDGPVNFTNAAARPQIAVAGFDPIPIAGVIVSSASAAGAQPDGSLWVQV